MLKKILYSLIPRFMDEISVYRIAKSLPTNFIDNLKALPGDSVTVDIGANVGLVSLLMSKYSTVHSFEPNTKAFIELLNRSARHHKIRPYKKAAGVTTQNSKLYLHQDSKLQETDLTQASSLEGSKPNVSEELYEEISEINFTDFLADLNHEISIIKIDIEGYEVKLINHMLDNCDFNLIGKIYVETHDHKWPELREPTQKMKVRVQEMGLNQKFDFNWV